MNPPDLRTIQRYDLASGRHLRPRTREELARWVKLYTPIRVPHRAVCRGHVSLLDILTTWNLDRPGMAVARGPRGGGKTLLSALDVHLESRFIPDLYTLILGGSKSQSQQVYDGLQRFIYGAHGPLGEAYTDRDQIAYLGKIETKYHNASTLQVLTASTKSVRGPHAPRLRLDEIDEMDRGIREAAIGMLVERGGVSPKAVYTSTHHRSGGSMDDLLEDVDRINADFPGTVPVQTFCVWDVLETCPVARSGPWVGGDDAFEKCPACPIRPWCHEGKEDRRGVPKAKLSAGGHYSIDGLITIRNQVSERQLRTDYFVQGPSTEGLFFGAYVDEPELADSNTQFFDPHPDREFFWAIDAGFSIHTGAWLYQAYVDREGYPRLDCIDNYYSDCLHSEENARAILGRSERLGVPLERIAEVTLDHSAGARSALGEPALAAYKKVFGDARVRCGRRHSVSDGIDFIDQMIRVASGRRGLRVHPRCDVGRKMFRSYRRKKRNGVYVEAPEDPQHPWEEMADALRYALLRKWPRGYPREDGLVRAPAAMGI